MHLIKRLLEGGEKWMERRGDSKGGRDSPSGTVYLLCPFPLGGGKEEEEGGGNVHTSAMPILGVCMHCNIRVERHAWALTVKCFLP